jgi:hypothetical protein
MEWEILTDDGAGQLSARLALGQGSWAREKKGRDRSPAFGPGLLSFGERLGVMLAARTNCGAGCTVLRLDPPALRAGHVVVIDRSNAWFF